MTTDNQDSSAVKSSYNPADDGPIRVSKSSLMTYMMCPRQFYWKYVAGIPTPEASKHSCACTFCEQ